MKQLYTLILMLVSFCVTAQMNLITDGDFEANNAASAWFGNALDIRNENSNSYNFANVETAVAAYEVNLSQVVTLTRGETYTLSFEASTGIGNTRTIIAGIGQNGAPYKSATETINLTSSNDTHTYDFIASFAGPYRVLFDMGADTGVVVIDNVSLVMKDTGPAAPNNLLLEDFSGSPNTNTFEGLTSAAVEDDPVTGGTNGKTLKLITNTGGNPWQGATIDFAAGSYANISTNKTIAVDVHATSAISIMAKVEDDSFSSPAAANTQNHTGSGWETLIFKFTTGSDNSTFANGTYTKISLYPNRNAGDDGWNDPIVDQTIYIDNIKSTEVAPQHQNGLQDGDETDVDCGGASAPPCAVDPAPTDAPLPPPTRNPWDVISVYGEAYETAIGLNNTNWDKATFADKTIAENVVLKVEIAGGDFVGADLGTKIDASEMTHFHIDYWIAGDLLVGQTMVTRWSNHAGGNAQTSSFQDNNTGPEAGTWKSRDIEIDVLTGSGNGDFSRAELAQVIITLAAAAGTYPSVIYIDNVYFYRDATASINDLESNVNVYPNPVENTLNVSAAVVIDAVSIYDLTGREVMRAKPNATAFSLDVADLNKGLYLVTVKAGEQELNTKLVK